MTSETEEERLRRLETRIAEMRKAQEPGPRKDEHYSMANQAWRMVVELVAGLVIGFGIGYGLDAVLGTSPFLLVLFILLGFAAGVNVMLRTAREYQARNQADTTADEKKRG
jgi:ATP synthase protein I